MQEVRQVERSQSSQQRVTSKTNLNESNLDLTWVKGRVSPEEYALLLEGSGDLLDDYTIEWRKYEK